MDDKMPRGRNPTVSTEELLEAIKEVNEPFGAEELAEHVAIDGPQIKNRLEPLVEEEIIGQKKIGGRNVYWPDCC